MLTLGSSVDLSVGLSPSARQNPLGGLVVGDVVPSPGAIASKTVFADSSAFPFGEIMVIFYFLPCFHVVPCPTQKMKFVCEISQVLELCG